MRCKGVLSDKGSKDIHLKHVPTRLQRWYDVRLSPDRDLSRYVRAAPVGSELADSVAEVIGPGMVGLKACESDAVVEGVRGGAEVLDRDAASVGGRVDLEVGIGGFREEGNVYTGAGV